MAVNLFSTLIFGTRNVDKTMNDNVWRLPVAVGQFTNAGKEIAKYDPELMKIIVEDNEIAKMLCTATKSTSPVLNAIKTGAEFASKHINPLICVAGGAKVLTADDKEKEFVNQAAALGVMFSAEKSYKALADYKNILSIADKLGKKEAVEKIVNSKTVQNLANKVGDKRLKTILNIAYGLGFVTASITGYNVGEKIAAKINGSRELDRAKNDLNMTQKAMATAEQGKLA